jgi:hypothetical protein
LCADLYLSTLSPSLLATLSMVVAPLVSRALSLRLR